MAKIVKTKQAGFTLIEILIYTALIGITVTSFITFSLIISNLGRKNYVIEEVNANSRNILSMISQKIRQAEAVISPTSGATSSILVLQVSGGSSTTISLQNGVINLRENGGQDIPISSVETLISDLSFSNLATSGQNDHIRTSFAIKYKNSSSIEHEFTQNIQTAISLRR